MKFTLILTVMAIALLAIVSAASAEEHSSAQALHQQVIIKDLGGPDNYIINHPTSNNDENKHAMSEQETTMIGDVPDPMQLDVNAYTVYEKTTMKNETGTETNVRDETHFPDEYEQERTTTEMTHFPDQVTQHVGDYPYTNQENVQIKVDGQDVPQNEVLDIYAYEDSPLLGHDQPFAIVVEAVQ